MDRTDYESPALEEFSPLPEEYAMPPEEAEFRPPDAAAEFSPPSGTEGEALDPALEFTPPGLGGGAPPPPSRRRRRIRRLLYAASAVVMAGLLFGHAAPPSPVIAPPEAPAVTASPAPQESPAPLLPGEPGGAADTEPSPTAEPAPEPTPPDKTPVIDAVFFQFSHEHHGQLRLSNTDALHSVRVTVREKILDTQVYEYYLTEAEIASGAFELPMLSTGDVYMANMDAYDAVNGWPEFEMTVDAWYENEAGDGEDTLTMTLEPEFELGFGFNYMRPDYDWDESVPPDSFYVTPWEEMDQIRYVINDPEAVTNPLTVSVDVSYNGQHASADDFETVIRTDEYTIVHADGSEEPHVGHTAVLLLRRPAWMPEEGTMHVTIVQYLASTGQQWVREFDFEYPERFDWEN